MALTPTKKKEESYPLQFLTPPAKKLSLRQIVDDGERVLFRSVSCGESWTPVSDGKGVKTTQVAFSKFIFPRKRKLSELFNKEDTRPMPPKKKMANPPLKLFTMLYWSVTLIVAIAIYFFMYARRTWEFAPVKMNLQRHVYGQNVAIDNLENALNLALRIERSSLVVFTGGVGVGKSMTASILLETFPWPGQAKKASIQNLPEQDLFTLMSIFGWNLLIVEDCVADIDENSLKLIDAMLNHAKAKDIKLFVILVCTVRGDDELSLLEELLLPMAPYSKVSFDTLSRESVRKCFNREILKMQLAILDDDLERMIDEHMKPILEVGGPPGCKQVDMKLIDFIDTADGD